MCVISHFYLQNRTSIFMFYNLLSYTFAQNFNANFMAEIEKLVIISTVGPENPEKATLPFVLATAAQAININAVIILQSSAVELANKGVAETIIAKDLMPLKDLMDSYINEWGVLNVCSPCLESREITSEDLVEGSQIIAAETIVLEILSAKSVVTY